MKKKKSSIRCLAKHWNSRWTRVKGGDACVPPQQSPASYTRPQNAPPERLRTHDAAASFPLAASMQNWCWKLIIRPTQRSGAGRVLPCTPAQKSIGTCIFQSKHFEAGDDTRRYWNAGSSKRGTAQVIHIYFFFLYLDVPYAHPHFSYAGVCS